MAKIIGVRFKQAGKIYHFSPGKIDVKLYDNVIVETARGMELGKVVVGVKEVNDKDIQQPVKNIARIATDRDLKGERDNKEREEEAIEICREKVIKHGLQMKIIQAEFTFDNNKVLFYFTADGRIDFRELVKDLASVFRTRIELRQIGVRDETKIRGGIGICGRELCCNKYLTDFSPVSIKMAKNQSISLNPTKISGVCGRLMCCLSNEESTYESLNSNLPPMGAKVETKDKLQGEVVGVTTLKQKVKVMHVNKAGEREFKEYQVEELRFKGTRKQQLSEQNNEIDDSVAKILDDGKKADRDNKSKKQKNEYKPHNRNTKNSTDNKDKSKQKGSYQEKKTKLQNDIKQGQANKEAADRKDTKGYSKHRRNKENTESKKSRN